MEIFGAVIGIYLSWLIFGAIAAAAGAEDYDNEGLTMRGFMVIVLLPWLPIVYVLWFVVWVVEKFPRRPA